MRIISGNFKGKQIVLPTTFHDRPTTDVAKEALFNVLNNWFNFENIKVLDIFSGSGSISYEFASRGCLAIDCVDNNKKYCDFIRKTFSTLYPVKPPSRVINADAFKFLGQSFLPYDVIFADPPFDLEGIENLPGIIFNNVKLNPEVVCIIEHSAGVKFTDISSLIDVRRYGKVHFSFFSKSDYFKKK